MVKVARWYADPIVAVGAVVAMACNGWVWFAGEYVNYIDYSNHLGLISILAHGADTGALAYADRSFAPVPYLLFYLISATFAQVDGRAGPEFSKLFAVYQRVKANYVEEVDDDKLIKGAINGMLFVRGDNAGISHNPLESITAHDAQLAVDAMLSLIRQLPADGRP